MPNSHVSEEHRASAAEQRPPDAEQRPPDAEQRPPDAQSAERDLTAQLAEMEDRFKRAVADLDNYRKRAARDVERIVAERRDAALLEWLEVVDALDRAVAQQPEGPLHEGLRAVLEQMEAILERQGVRRIGAPGEPFDPTRHEAVDVRDTEEAPDRTVVAVLRSGYARGDRILRPAQVVVARRPQPHP